ncbi:hypothetical protein OG900_37310 [Streptomyces sp. NBC_00433]
MAVHVGTPQAAARTSATLPAGLHTIVVGTLSGRYATLDGFGIDKPTP